MSDPKPPRPGGPARLVDDRPTTPSVLGSGQTLRTRDDARSFAPGARIANRYRVVELLGAGGMGVVYRVHDEALGIDVALKLLRPEFAFAKDFLQRFRNELVVARRVTHRHVVRLHDLGEHEGLYFMTMDFVAGRSLRDVLHDEGRLELDEAARILREIAEALAEAHRQGVVHRDLKPANILLDAHRHAYVTDFGIARSLDGPGMTRTGEVLGTPDYLSPEQARGATVDGRSDVFTLGVMFVEMLSGKLPFPQGSVFEVLAQRMTGRVRSLTELGVTVPVEWAAIVERCVAKDPERRYTAAELLADLGDLARARRRRRLRRLRPIAAAVAGVALVGFAGWSLARWLIDRAGAGDAPGAANATPADGISRLRHAVAVAPFAAGDGPLGLGAALADGLAERLRESSALRVVDSVAVLDALRRGGFRGELSDQDLATLAHLLAVDRVVAGEIVSPEGTPSLRLRLLAADGEAPETRALEAVAADGLGPLLFAAGGAVLGNLEVEVPPAGEAPSSAGVAALAAFGRGLEALTEGPAAAVAPLEEAVDAAPELAPAWLHLAGVYEAVNRPDDARDAAGEAARTSAGGSRIASLARAREALLRGDPAAARTELAALVERLPGDHAARVALAEAHARAGALPAAAGELRQAVRLVADDPDTWFLLGRYSIQAGEATRATEPLAKALTLYQTAGDPAGEAGVYNALGVGLTQLRRYDAALENYGRSADKWRALGDELGVAKALQNVAEVHRLRSEPAEAEENLRTALAIYEKLGLHEHVASAANAFGGLAEARGDYGAALGHYRKALDERMPLGDGRAVAESRNNVGFAYFLLGDYDNATLNLEASLELYRQNQDPQGEMQALQSLAFTQVARGDWTAAAVSLQASLDLARETQDSSARAVAEGNLGLVARYQGRYREAAERCAAALEVLSGGGQEQRGLVEFTLQAGETEAELGDVEGAAQRASRVAAWDQEETLESEQRSRLRGLEADLALRSGDVAAARRLYAAARAEAEASHHATALVAARLGEAAVAVAAGERANGLTLLSSVHSDAAKLKHAALELRSAELFAEALLTAGRAGDAEATLRDALRRAERDGWARAFRLHDLLATVLEAGGDTRGAERQRQSAAREVARLRDGMTAEQWERFARLPEVAPLAALAPAAPPPG